MPNTEHYPEVVKTFLEIIKIDNPSQQEDELILWIVDKLSSIGVQSIEQDDLGNVIARIESNIDADSEKNSVMFITHLDSVAPCNGIEPEIIKLEDDSLIKPKTNTVLTADDKAGVSAVIEAIKIIKQENIQHPDIELIFTVQEEIGLRGAKALDFSSFKSQMAYSIDAEAPVGTIITQGPSQKRFTLEFKGKAAHAGMSPEEGINAISIATDFLNAISLGRIDDATTSNVGMISGGIANNVIPEKVILHGEVRSLYETKLDGIIGSYELETKKVLENYPDAECLFKDSFVYHSFFIDTNSPVVQLGMKACDNINIEPQIKSIGSGSDANIFNYNNIPTVILGVGFKNSHSDQECITFSQLQLICDLLVSIIQEAKNQDV
jgi:tripeptide aminopeptidase